MKKLVGVLAFALLSHVSFAGIDLEDQIKKFDWNGVEVIWLEDNRLPLYNLVVYFADGALSDAEKGKGTTQAMFSLIDSGTRRYDQKSIAENLEFYGASYGASVTHEATSYVVSGMVKDIIPTMKQICHLFRDATFPPKEIKKATARKVSALKNMKANPMSLATRLFRELSLSGTPFSYPVGGKLKDVKYIKQKVLKQKLEYFNKKVKKRIYLSGPKMALKVKNVLLEDCAWKGEGADFSRTTQFEFPKRSEPEIYLANLPSANQAQVRVGRILDKEEIKRPELLSITSGFMGGGFTSLLMNELRIKSGLTYTAYSVAGPQKDYGRVVNVSFTKLETVDQLLEKMKYTFSKVTEDKFRDEELELARGYLMGSYPFGFEKNSAFLSQLVNQDHLGRDYQEIVEFPEMVEKIKRKEVVEMAKKIYNWNDQVIVILGPRKLKNKLEEFGKVKVINYQDYL